MVTLLFAVYTGDAILVRVVTHALVVRVVRFICRILLAWLPSFLVIGLLEVVRLAEVTLWSKVWTYGINFFFLGHFQIFFFACIVWNCILAILYACFEFSGFARLTASLISTRRACLNSCI